MGCLFIDSDGMAPDDIILIFKNSSGKQQSFTFNGNNSKNAPKNEFVQDFIQAYNYNISNGGGDNMKEAATNKSLKIKVADSKAFGYNKSFYDPSVDKGGKVVYWNSRQAMKTTEGGYQSPATTAEHEIDHAVHDAKFPDEHSKLSRTKDDQYENKEEKRVITGSERKTAIKNGESIRYNHGGSNIPVEQKSTLSCDPNCSKL